MQTPDATTLQLQPDKRDSDPALAGMVVGAPVGLLGIELPTRRRNRVNGRIQAVEDGQLTMAVDQAFGNCPQYIQTREVIRVEAHNAQQVAVPFTQLTSEAKALIRSADTLFVASVAPAADRPKVHGVDVSHRGGRPGFVRVQDSTLTIPDFRGNNHFNTLGNFVLNPKAGLVFPDFATGDLLQVTGSVVLLDADHPDVAAFDGAERAFQVQVSHGQWLRGALPFRFGPADPSPRNAQTGTWV